MDKKDFEKYWFDSAFERDHQDEDDGERRAEEQAEREMARFWKWKEEGLI